MSDPDLSEDIIKRSEILAEIANLLGTKDVSFGSIAPEIDALSDEELQLRVSINRLSFIEDELAHGISDLNATHKVRWKERLGSELFLSETSASIERKRENLIRKAKELNKELATVLEETTESPATTITQLAKQQEKNVRKEQELREKRTKRRAYQGLPANLELAGYELLQAQEEQTKLFQLRERLLGSMADSVS
ncbi:hypothetical protein NP233_g3404 [Leucocoprinus birnbaumii]|uniref:Uncharacterized protein n=1 Tax=Leucocoprinus birnbaumii TaxID=56174 RepID=A0AAD5VWJ7_9AGAR|nr:hypothetical protein NP233_g3404 [Leucocoprinus birnbaumii]